MGLVRVSDANVGGNTRLVRAIAPAAARYTMIDASVIGVGEWLHMHGHHHIHSIVCLRAR